MGVAAWGHGLHVFATAEGKTISGDVYFSDGKGAAGAALWWEGPGGERLGDAIADGSGKFSFDAAYRSDLIIVADSSDGHRAEHRIFATELPDSLPPLPQGLFTAERAAPSPLSRDRLHTDADATGAGAIEALVEDAVARQVKPLREQIDRLQNSIRLRDILGGVGFIVGAAGLMALVKTRSNKEGS